MKQAIIYRRVSSKRQSEEGKSLEDQDAELEIYCKALGYQIIGNFEDAVSGRREKTDKRKGLEKAVNLACETKATVVVYDLNRLARSITVGMRIVERLRDCGANIIVKSLGIDTATPAGEMILGVMFSIAQMESKNIGEGVKRANRQTVKKKGYRTQGQQRFGWRIVDGEKVKIAEEQELIATVKKYYKQHKSQCATAKALQADGVPTPTQVRYKRKSKWHQSAVAKLLA